MKSRPLPVRVRMQKRQNAAAPPAHMKNQQVQRQQRCSEGITEIAHAHLCHKKNARGYSRTGDGSTQIGLQDNKSKKKQHGRGCRKQRIAPVVHALATAFEKISKKQNQYRLGQLGRLQRETTPTDPTVSIVRAI